MLDRAYATVLKFQTTKQRLEKERLMPSTICVRRVGPKWKQEGDCDNAAGDVDLVSFTSPKSTLSLQAPPPNASPPLPSEQKITRGWILFDRIWKVEVGHKNDWMQKTYFRSTKCCTHPNPSHARIVVSWILVMMMPKIIVMLFKHASVFDFCANDWQLPATMIHLAWFAKTAKLALQKSVFKGILVKNHIQNTHKFTSRKHVIEIWPQEQTSLQNSCWIPKEPAPQRPQPEKLRCKGGYLNPLGHKALLSSKMRLVRVVRVSKIQRAQANW